MTTPLRFFLCGRNLADSAVITSTVAPFSSLPLSNLQRSSRARVWRSQNATAQDLLFSLPNGSDKVNFVGLFRHNLEGAATWRVRMYPTLDGSGAASYDSTAVLAYDASTLGGLDFGVSQLGSNIYDGFLQQRQSVFYFLENVATDIGSVRITISDTTNSQGFIEASRVFFGRGIELTYNYETLKYKWNENTTQDRTDGGSILSDGNVSFREIQADLKWVSPAQRSDISDIARYAGMRKDMFVSARPGVGGKEERDHTMVCRSTQQPDLSTLFYDVWSSQFKFAEV